ncbi:camp-binding domain-like protein [Rhizoclosmatium globosum]|uniref:Camp-binding domain-like protein n=1 Tax=Rhizoclosmatium globosum TaxID=329046 RepID=A0A1Y2CLE7_9FUNG|nr:camp-binding domain-like protein [Rhizoclosmatium globosum]|eukprot:ORY47830.1 camp-binding domain-like protein [Rhizoclosmatium globosum]
MTFRENHHAISAIKEPTLNSWRVHYLYNRLPVDLITTFPFELLPVTGAEYLWAVRLLRMYKLAYIASTCPIYKHAKKQLLQYFKIGHSVSLIFPLTFIFLSFMHIQACSIFLAGRLLGFSNAEIDPYKNQAFFDQYAWSLYMAATNMFPVGYHPVNSEEQLITVFFVIAGAAIYACIVGVISSIAMGVDASGRLYKQKIDELKDYMQYKLIEPVTQRKILKYYELKYRGKYFEEGSLLQDMNDSLRMEVAIHNCRELISKVPFLRREQGDGRDDLFAGQITSALEPCYYVPGDFVFVQGDIGKDMYFIASGTVCVKISGKGVAFLKDGAFFGEMALVANSPRTATIQAVSTCILYKLRQESFESICRVFTDVKHNLEMTYAERLEKVQKIENAKKTTIARIMVFKMPCLVNLDNDAKTAIVETLANVLAPVNFFPGFVVLKQGDDDALVSFEST